VEQPTNLDLNGQTILDPVAAALGEGYPDNVGFFCVCGGLANVK
jgi:hypothetical protein